MAYKDEDKRREATKERVKKHRAAKKALQNVTEVSICPDCEGRGYHEFEHGLVRLGCKTCGGSGR